MMALDISVLKIMIHRIFRNQLRTTPWSVPCQGFSSPSSRIPPTVNNLTLHYPQGFAKVFKIKYDATTQDVVSLIRKEEPSFQSVLIQLGDQNVTGKDISFLDLVLHNSPTIAIDSHHYSFELDLNGSAPYFSNSELEDAFCDLEIPYFDALVISRFHALFKENLPHNQQLYSPQEIELAIKKTLQKFADENHSNSEYWVLQQKVLENLDTVVAYYEGIVEEVRQEAQNQGHKLLKRLIVFALAQYFFLLYLTYGVYDWGVSEPISYLLAQSMETVALLYFIRKGIAFKQSHLFRSKFDETFKKLINKRTNSTHFMRDLNFARQKAALANARILYGTTSV